jgi:hypothetical protein
LFGFYFDLNKNKNKEDQEQRDSPSRTSESNQTNITCNYNKPTKTPQKIYLTKKPKKNKQTIIINNQTHRQINICQQQLIIKKRKKSGFIKQTKSGFDLV